MNFDNLKKRSLTSLILLFIVLIIFNNKIFSMYILIVIGVLSSLEFANLSKKIFKNRFYSFISILFFIIYIFSLCFLFYYFTNFIILKFFIILILSGCIASDLGGYFFGKIIKGPKLSKFSPNKTVSGSLGSFILTTFVICGITNFQINEFNFQIFLVALLTSFACQTGDLFFSYLKRKAKIKDSGNFLPGHGGILDRIDGILFGLPIGFSALVLFY